MDGVEGRKEEWARSPGWKKRRMAEKAREDRKEDKKIKKKRRTVRNRSGR